MNCSPVSGAYFKLELDSEGAKATYSTLLAAMMADRKVSIYAKAAAGCEIGYVLLDR